MKITKIKQKHWVLTLEFSETLTVNGEATTVTTSTTYEHLAHPDFRAAFDRLKPFMCDLSDQVVLDDDDVRTYTDIRFINNDFKGYAVSGLAVEGSDYGIKVSIAGTRTLRNDALLAITTPKRKIFDELTAYNYAEQLNEVIKLIIDEAEQYVAGKAANEQTAMDFDEEEETEEAA